MDPTQARVIIVVLVLTFLNCKLAKVAGQDATNGPVVPEPVAPVKPVATVLLQPGIFTLKTFLLLTMDRNLIELFGRIIGQSYNRSTIVNTDWKIAFSATVQFNLLS